ncbi:MAG: lipopolysaccharide biosynthesis protein RfbH [Chloroflexi bacterium]|nr:lipopolysaccharide biosynthesis protein RfbH [Chloroflexota bacterium]
MKALVIGASGMTGGALMRALEQYGAEAIGTYQHRRINGATLSLDIRDRNAVDDCLRDVQPDVVFLAVNPAGGVDYCEGNPEDARSIHIEGTCNVATAAGACGATVVYYSTDYIFDGAAGPYSEEDEPAPVNAYGRTKWEAEEILRKIAPKHLILRTTAVYGWDRTSKNFAMQIWERLETGKATKVPNDQWCNPTLAEYLAEVSIRLVQAGAEGVFNVVGQDRMARSELATALARCMALDPELIVPVPTSELGSAAARPLQGGLQTEKLQDFLGTEPLGLYESLKRLRRHWRADTYVSGGPGTTTTEADELKQEILDKVKQYYHIAHKPQQFIPFKSRINYAGTVFGEEEIVNLVDSSLVFWLTMGPFAQQFEQRLKRFFGSKDFLMVNSGSSANLTAVMTMMSDQLEHPLRAGDEVLTPAVTFPTTLAPIVQSGLIPVFVDCEVGTYNINPNLLEDAISDKTRAIIVPHTLGNPCDMDVICDLAKRHDLYLMEDSCDALGSTFRGKQVGTFGDIATLSFFPAHHITTGEGGGVVVNSANLVRIARSVRDWGRDCWCAPGESNTCGKRFGWQLGELPKGYDHKFTYSNIGFNFKPTDMQAAVGVGQLNRLDDFGEKRRQNFKRFYKGLEEYQDQLILPTLDPRSDPSWFGFPITTKNGASRQELVQWLESANIETRQVFAGNILRQPAYKNIRHRVHGTLEESDRVMRDTFFIGVYPGLTDEMAEFILTRFKEFFAGSKSSSQEVFAASKSSSQKFLDRGESTDKLAA